MIRNYCTTVLLIWFQGGFDALLYSFHVGSTDLTSAVYTSAHMGEFYSMPL